MSGMSRRDLQAIKVPVSHPKVGSPGAIRKVILGGAEVIAKMDELENAENGKVTVAEYDVIRAKLRDWLEANAAQRKGVAGGRSR